MERATGNFRRAAGSNREPGSQARVHSYRGLIHGYFVTDDYPAAFTEDFQVLQRGPHGFVATLVIRVAKIERCPHLAGNDVHRAGRYLEGPDRRHQMLFAGSHAFQIERPLRGAGKGVTPPAHGSGAGVIRRAFKSDPQAGDPGNLTHHRQRYAALFHHRTLFDMELQVGEYMRGEAGGGDLTGVESVVADGLGNRHAGCVPAREGGLIESTRYRAAADEGKTETNRLFLRETNNFQGTTRIRLGHGDAEHDADDSIKRAGIDHGVQMGGDQKARAIQWAPETPDITGGINGDSHTGLAHPFANQTMDVAHGRRQERARGSARLFGKRSQLTAAGDDLFGAAHELQLKHWSV